MTRSHPTAIAAHMLSLALLALTLTASVRSRWYQDDLIYTPTRHHGFVIGTTVGAAVLATYRVDHQLPDRTLAFESGPAVSPPRDALDVPTFLDFSYERSRGMYSVSFPFWLPAASLAASAWLTSPLRRPRCHKATNTCLRCGYDLRATPMFCPECGTPTPAISSLPSIPQ